jgi:hypothetical protein
MEKCRSMLGLKLTGLLLLLAIISPVLLAFLAINVAQLEQLRGVNRVDLYRLALSLAPFSRHIRWQTGAALARVGEAEAAATTLLPLLNEQLNSQIAQTLLTALVDADRLTEALQVYQQLPTRTTINPDTATRMLTAVRSMQHDLGSNRTQWLFATAFGLDFESKDSNSLVSQSGSESFWVTDLGFELFSALNGSTRRDFLPPAKRSESVAVETIVAQTLDVSVNELSLGPEQVVNGDFARWDSQRGAPVGWSPSYMTNGKIWNVGLFVLSVRDGIAQVRGVYIENEESKEPARAGFWHLTPIRVEPHTPYVLSFLYRTDDMPPQPTLQASVWVTAEPFVLIQNDYPLPSTEGKWKRVVIIGWNQSGRRTTIQLLLRSFSIGVAEFTQISLRKIVVPQFIHPAPTMVVIQNVDR